MRLVGTPGRLSAITAVSKSPRLAAKMARGNLGDFWTPAHRTDAKALSFSPSTTHYKNLAHLLFDDAFILPPALSTRAEQRQGARLVARGLAGGKWLTEGYFERTDIAFSPAALTAFGNSSTRTELAELAKAQMAEIDEVMHALRFAIAIAASGGKPAEELSQRDRQQADPYSRRLDRVADARFFTSLQDRFQAPSADARADTRTRFIRAMIEAGHTLLAEALGTVPCPAVFRHRATVHATQAYWGLLRRPEGIFHDEHDTVFERRERSVPAHGEQDADNHFPDTAPTLRRHQASASGSRTSRNGSRSSNRDPPRRFAASREQAPGRPPSGRS